MIGGRRRDRGRGGRGRGGGSAAPQGRSQAAARRPYSPSIDLSSLSERANMDDSQFVTRVPIVDNAINRAKNIIRNLGTIEERDENGQAIATLMSTAENIHNALEGVRANRADAQSDVKDAYERRDKAAMMRAVKKLKETDRLNGMLGKRLDVVESHITQHSLADIDTQYMDGMSISNKVLRAKHSRTDATSFEEVADDAMDNMRDADEREEHFVEMSRGIAESADAHTDDSGGDDTAVLNSPSVMEALGIGPAGAGAGASGSQADDPFWASIEKMKAGIDAETPDTHTSDVRDTAQGAGAPASASHADAAPAPSPSPNRQAGAAREYPEDDHLMSMMNSLPSTGRQQADRRGGGRKLAMSSLYRPT